jgi:hypothetical protein
MDEPREFITRKIEIITANFHFLMNDFGFDEPIIKYSEYWVEVVYDNYSVNRKVTLLHDLKEKYFYFYVAIGNQTEYSKVSRNRKTFLEVFQHSNVIIRESDIQPDSNEPSELKLKVNARFLEQYGREVLSGNWF